MKAQRYWIAIAVTAFLAPLLGGQIPLDPQAIEPGGLLGAIWNGSQGALLAHFLVVLPLLGAFVVALTKRHVLQLPDTRIAVALGVFLLFLWGSVLTSQYSSVSYSVAFEWTAMVLGLFAVVGLAGRQQGPVAILGAFVAGTALVAALGIREYAMQHDPNWRIFSNWANPNALAGLMPFGVLGGLGLLVTSKERLAKLGAGLAAFLSMIALVLTASKGGLLAMAVGLVVLALWWVLAGGKRRLTLAAIALALPAIAFAAAVGLTASQRAKTASGGPALSRLAQAGNTQEQSAGFRTLLWKSAVELIKDQPFGRGIGTFRFHSARPGIITQTHLAHQSLLQLGVEVGIISLGALLLAIAFMAIEGVRSNRDLPEPVRLLRGAVFAALGAAIAHNLIDSDLYVMGTGLGFFIFCGLLLVLSPDGFNPEYTPRRYRMLGVALISVTGIALAYFAWVDVKLGELRFLAGTGSPQTAPAFDALVGVAPRDHRVWSLGARLAPELQERERRLARSIELGPTMSALRMLSAERQAKDDFEGARRYLQDALRLDPNNLSALWRLVQVHEATGSDEARITAERLLHVESTPYYKIRSLPELVPTETFKARAWLARKASGSEAAALLRGALEGYLSYARNTVPMIVMFAKADLDGGYGGITREEAHTTLTEAIDLVGLFEGVDPRETSFAAETRAVLEEARNGL